MGIKYEYNWKESTPHLKLTVPRAAHTNRLCCCISYRNELNLKNHTVGVQRVPPGDNPHACAAAYVDEFLKRPQISRFGLKHDS